MSGRSRRLDRLAEELDEAGLDLSGDTGASPHAAELVLEEIDHAMRPPIHERRVPSSGTILGPTTEPGAWEAGTGLAITHAPVGEQPLDAARRFADGLSCWLLRSTGRASQWLIFDRPAGSERDLGVIARVMGATVVQRHPTGPVRVVGDFGILRWDGYSWYHQPPVSRWIDVMQTCSTASDVNLFHTLLEFAVHDLGAVGIGALLIYRGHDTEGPGVEHRLPAPPPLRIDEPIHLAPLRHALAQVDGAAIFDSAGVLRELGVRLVPSSDAENGVDGFKGTRHTSGRRYSYDDPDALVIAVSEDGPVSVFYRGEILGRSQPTSD